MSQEEKKDNIFDVEDELEGGLMSGDGFRASDVKEDKTPEASKGMIDLDNPEGSFEGMANEVKVAENLNEEEVFDMDSGENKGLNSDLESLGIKEVDSLNGFEKKSSGAVDKGDEISTISQLKSFVVGGEKKDKEEEIEGIKEIDIKDKKTEFDAGLTAIPPIKKEEKEEEVGNGVEGIKEVDLSSEMGEVSAISVMPKGRDVSKDEKIDSAKVSKKKGGGFEIPTLRTYQGDIQSAVSSDKTSAVSIAMAEAKKKKKSGGVSIEKESDSTKNALFVVLGFVFIFAGLAFAAYFFILKQTVLEDAKVGDISVPKIIEPNYQKGVGLSSFTGLANRKKFIDIVRDEIDTTNIELGAIRQFYFTKKGDTSGEEIINTEQFLSILEARVSERFLRSLSAVFMFGVHSTFGNEPFLIMKTNSYGVAYDGLNDWERNGMLGDLIPLIAPNVSIEDAAFRDITIRNKDMRAVLDEEGKIVFAYSILPDRETVVFVTNEVTLEEIYTGLTTKKFREIGG